MRERPERVERETKNKLRGFAGGSRSSTSGKKKLGSSYLEWRLVVEGVEGHLALLELERDLLAHDLHVCGKGERGYSERGA